MDLNALVIKYSTPGPRYTSYPTAPQFSETIGIGKYRERLASDFLQQGETLGLYVHLPFCESLCYYCGCNIQITHDKTRSSPYVDSVCRELETVAGLLPRKTPISLMSWGGGTPTFLSLPEIEKLYKTIDRLFSFAPGADVSIEVDPRVTSNEQLRLLRSLGFTRVSLGVQDFDPDVQKAVNRIQPQATTAAMLAECRRLGFTGINFDMIYGLPLQTEATFERTLDELIQMHPDRIALYNYARLPDVLKHQKILEKYPFVSAEERVRLFTRAYERLVADGYMAIGMDHFADKNDSLAKSVGDGRLYRNFMGYVVRHATQLLGVGASAIGEAAGGFFQNIKGPKEYEESIAKHGLATQRGFLLSEEDVRRKWIIQQILCDFRLSPAAYQAQFAETLTSRYKAEWDKLSLFVGDDILRKDGNDYVVTDLGRLFVRNVAMLFDEYLTKPHKATYSRTV